jgi:hypothetical protein
VTLYGGVGRRGAGTAEVASARGRRRRRRRRNPTDVALFVATEKEDGGRRETQGRGRRYLSPPGGEGVARVGVARRGGRRRGGEGVARVGEEAAVVGEDGLGN